MNDGTIRVGVPRQGYIERRNILDLPFENVETCRTFDAFRLPDYLAYHVLGRSFPRLRFSYQDFGLNRVDLLHLFFSVSFAKTPWIVSFSSYVPRWSKQSRRGLQRLASESCRRLIAISESAWRIQLGVMEAFPEFVDDIAAKVTIVHPQQMTQVQSYDEKQLDPELIDVTLVGADFFRKGGKEALRAVSRHIDCGAPFRLNIVSSLRHGDYATLATPQDVQEVRAFIDRHPGRVRHFARLPNPRVLDLLRRSHLALLPTYADTYGYSVLEAQACACPVVTTNVRAMPEINDDESGWVIDVPRDSLGNGLVQTVQQREVYSAVLEETLDAILCEVRDDPAIVRRKGAAALARIRSHHDPRAKARQVEGIYRAALGA